MATVKKTPAVVEETVEELVNPPILEIPHVITNAAPYLDPTGAAPETVSPGTDVDFTPACPGSAGAKPVLTDIQNQMAENTAAAREKREPLAVRVRCLLCGFFHKEQQSNVDNLTTMDNYGYENVQKPAPEPDAPNSFELQQAANAVNGTSVEGNSDESTEDSDGSAGAGSDVQSTGEGATS